MLTTQKRMNSSNNSRTGDEHICYREEAPRTQRRRLNVSLVKNKDKNEVHRHITHYSNHDLTHGGYAAAPAVTHHREAVFNTADLIGASSPGSRVLDDRHEPWVLVRESPKQCHSCGTNSTPEWRKGPMGPRTLCNACGLLWAKLARNQRDAQEHNGPSPTKEPVNNKQPSREAPTNANKCALSFLLS